MRFVLLPGRRYDSVGVPPLTAGIAFDALIGGKAFGSNWVIAELDERGAKAAISQHPRRVPPLPVDEERHERRRLIENCSGRLKEFKRIAMRAGKTDQSFAANRPVAKVVQEHLSPHWEAHGGHHPGARPQFNEISLV